jgi:hypothetical protein
MTSNGTHFVAETSYDPYKGKSLTFEIKASDNSGNTATETIDVDVPKRTPGFTFFATALIITLVGTLIAYRRRKV